MIIYLFFLALCILFALRPVFYRYFFQVRAFHRNSKIDIAAFLLLFLIMNPYVFIYTAKVIENSTVTALAFLFGIMLFGFYILTSIPKELVRS